MGSQYIGDPNNAAPIFAFVNEMRLRKRSIARSRIIRPHYWAPTVVLTRDGNLITAIATSMLSGTVYFHWYLDGVYVASTTTGRWSFVLEAEERVQVSVIDTTSESFDPVANAPEGFPARRTIRWIRATYDGIAWYEVSQTKIGDSPVVIGRVKHDERRWAYSLRTPILDDLADYSWSVMSIFGDNNEGNNQSIGGPNGETVVRTPDAPRFTITFEELSKKVGFLAAS